MARLAIGGLLGALFMVLGFTPNAMAAPVSHFRINNVSLTEGDAGTSDLTFTVSYTGTKNNISVDWATADGTAAGGADYVASSGTATFTLAGATSQTITVPVNGDLLDEANETFTVNLTNPTPAATADITTPTGTGTINDNDPTPSIVISDVSQTEGSAGSTNANFAVTLSTASGRNVTVNYTTANGTATQPGDYAATTGTLTFLPGEVLQTMPVPIVGDLIDENDETYVVKLSAPTNATIADNQGAGTIVNDDTAPTIAIDDPSLTEGNSGTANMPFTVTLSSASGKTVTVAYATADGTATAPADYTAASGTVTFAAGQTSRPITAAVRGDTLDELDETFAVNLTTPTNATIADTQGVGTILDNDAPPSLTVNNATATEVDAGSVNATFTVTASAASAKTMTVDFATADATATAPADYTATSGTLTFPPGLTTQTLTVAVQGDVLDEANETYTVMLSNPVNATTASTGVGTITDNDPTPSLIINDVSVAEGDAGTANASYTVTLSAPSGRNVTVNYATANGTAVQPGDYTSTSGTLTFLPGVTTMPINVPVVGDLLNEANEAYVVNLSAASNATIADPQGAGAITDNDPLPSIAINDVSLTEGNAGTTPAAFSVTLSAPSGRNVTVRYATANGTAVQPGDYTSTSGTLTFLPGVTTMPINVPVVADLLDELDETYVVNLTTPGSATIADAQGAGTIVDDDAAPTLAINDVSLTEGNSGTANLVFTLSLSAASGQTVTVAAATANGTAVQPSDYTNTSSTVTFAPGQTTKSFTVPVVGDLVVEPDEVFFVNLSGATNATIADAQGIGTILNNDLPPTISVNDVSLTEGDAGAANLTFTIALSWATGSTVTVNAATADGTAAAPGDYTTTSGVVTFTAGQTSRTFVVLVRGDLLDEFDETFFTNLSGATNATIADAQSIGTIVDNDPPPSVVVNDVSKAEGNSGSSDATFTLTLSAPSGKMVTVDAATADGTATQPGDYASTSSTVTFTPGQTTRTFVVPVNGDTTDEGDETFVVDLTNQTNAVITDAEGMATITDDDVPALSVDDVTVTEGDAGLTTATFTVSLSGSTALTSSVDVATEVGTADLSDIDANTTTLTFLPGVTTHTFDVVVHGDTTFENDETFGVRLTNPTAAQIVGGVGVGTIVNDDVAPGLSVGDVSVPEGTVGTTPATFTVSLGSPSAFLVRVDVETRDGSAAAPGDYDALSTTVTFLPGETSHTVDVLVEGDTVSEGNETFTVELSNEVGASISAGTGHGTIVDDEGALTLSVDDVVVPEGDAGSVPATFTVSLSSVAATPVTVDYATHDGSAHAPGDYGSATGSVTFAPGETWKTVDVLVKGDRSHEDDETFTLDLSNPVNTGILEGSGTATIQDDDASAVRLSVGDTSAVEGPAGSTTNATFTVHLTNGTDGGVRVDYATHDGSATAGADYTAVSGTLTFAPGQTSATVDVPVTGDDVAEGDETFALELSDAVGAVAVRDGTGTIVDGTRTVTRITLRAKGRHHHVLARGRILRAEPGMRVQVVLLKRMGDGVVKIARETVQVHVRIGRGAVRTGIFTTRFGHRSRGRYLIRAIFHGDATHLPTRAHAHVRL